HRLFSLSFFAVLRLVIPHILCLFPYTTLFRSSSGFASREAARAWVEKFVLWYNTKHRHSKLNFVTPEQRHNNEDAHILAQRKKRSEEHTSELQSRFDLVCPLLLEKTKTITYSR